MLVVFGDYDRWRVNTCIRTWSEVRPRVVFFFESDVQSGRIAGRLLLLSERESSAIIVTEDNGDDILRTRVLQSVSLHPPACVKVTSEIQDGDFPSCDGIYLTDTLPSCRERTKSFGPSARGSLGKRPWPTVEADGLGRSNLRMRLGRRRWVPGVREVMS